MKPQLKTFGSVCSGIEAASVAWAPLGLHALWLAEIEPFPSAVLKERFPLVPNLGDMTTIAERIRSGEIPAPDILTGGTPCQAFSVAGLRRGLEDDRGKLTLSFVEICNAIDEQRANAGLPPCVVIWENVPGVLSSADNAFGCFLSALAGEDSEIENDGERWASAGAFFGKQRRIAWRVLDAQHYGVAQRRRRVWLVAGAGDFDPTEILFECESLPRDFEPGSHEGQAAAAGTGSGTESAMLFNAEGSIGATLTASNIGKILNNQTPLVVKQDAASQGVRRLTPRECERLQGFPDDFTLISWKGKSAPDSLRYKALGNSWAVPCARWVMERVLAAGVTVL